MGKSLTESDPKDYDNKTDLLSFNQIDEKPNPQNHLESKGILLQLFSRFIVTVQI
ncbi:MAG: hypothetical protein KTR26_02915 [Flammeovirgaceae bacterium]|nr:hypothetical protein [Flammeovirgaceae bacterium]